MRVCKSSFYYSVSHADTLIIYNSRGRSSTLIHTPSKRLLSVAIDNLTYTGYYFLLSLKGGSIGRYTYLYEEYVPMHKQFGQKDMIEADTRRWKVTYGYFLRRCECGKNSYITQEELLGIYRKTNIPLPLRSILTERLMRKVHVPKLSLIVEWRRLEELKRIPLAREEKITALRRSGLTLAQIGDKFGMTRQRVHQIVKKMASVDNSALQGA